MYMYISRNMQSQMYIDAYVVNRFVCVVNFDSESLDLSGEGSIVKRRAAKVQLVWFGCNMIQCSRWKVCAALKAEDSYCRLWLRGRALGFAAAFVWYMVPKGLSMFSLSDHIQVCCRTLTINQPQSAFK